MIDPIAPKTLNGRSLAPGLAAGRIYVYRDDLNRFDEFYDIEESQVEEEQSRFEAAVERSVTALESLSDRVEEEIDTDLSDVFATHALMVQDSSLRGEVTKMIGEDLVSAGSAIKIVFRRWERRFRNMEAEVSQEKADDMKDLANRLVASLAGVRAHALEDLPRDSVLVASRLLPTDTIFLARRNAAAAILEVGGSGSHAALFAHEVGLPCVAGIENALTKLPDGSRVLVDADSGNIIIEPSDAQENAFRKKQQENEQAISGARERSREPAVTTDGVRVCVMANIGSRYDVETALEMGAEGIGLYRIERAYLGRQKPPDMEKLYREMRDVLEPAMSLPISIRLLDVGADKPLPYLTDRKETNPALGCRGIRFLERHEDLLTTQLDALAKLSREFDLKVIVPMVTLPEDLDRVRDLLSERLENPASIALGAMIETPAAALNVEAIAERCDFLSVGTNDLTQYLFAADRENDSVDRYFDDGHDVVFKILSQLKGDVDDRSVSICGELASRVDCVPKMLRCRIDTLSVAPPAIPMIKEAVRQCSATS